MPYEVKPEILDKFFDFLEYLIRAILPDNPNEMDSKVGKYLMQYIQERLAEMLDRYDNYNQIPIMNITFYADHDGKTDIHFRATPEAEILTNFKLPQAAKLILAACEEWEKKLDEPFEMPGVVGPEFDALKKHIKDTKK